MKTWEYLDFFAAAYRKHESQRKKLVDDVLEITDLTGKRDAFIETLSKGMRQRLGVAKTLLHDPKVLILDEPASGLDPRARIELKELLKELTRMGKTIFISSHILPELADICNTIGILEAGNLLAYGAVQDFIDNLPKTEVRTVRIRALEESAKLREALKSNEKIVEIDENSGMFIVRFQGGLEDMSNLLDDLVERKLKVIEFFEKTADLEDIFLRITKGVVVCCL
jgi:ABC-2 type transport system ATP-binding protein